MSTRPTKRKLLRQLNRAWAGDLTRYSQLLDLMKVNAELNVDTPNIHIAEYDWGETPAGIPIEKADIVLAADCVYFEVRCKTSGRKVPANGM